MEDILCDDLASMEAAKAHEAGLLPCYHKCTIEDAVKIVSLSELGLKVESPNQLFLIFKFDSALKGLHAMHQLNITHGNPGLNNLIVPTANPHSAAWIGFNPYARVVDETTVTTTWEWQTGIDLMLVQDAVAEVFLQCKCKKEAEVYFKEGPRPPLAPPPTQTITEPIPSKSLWEAERDWESERKRPSYVSKIRNPPSESSHTLVTGIEACS